MKRLTILVASLLLIICSSAMAQSGNGKSAGVAINPVFALFEVGSGEVNFWNIGKQSEINVPFFIARNPYFVEDDDLSVNFFSTGVNYRYFFSEQQQGFFAQAGVHIARGTVEDNFGDSVTGTTQSVLFGFGYRKIAQNGLFWGAGLSAGRSWGDISDPSGNSVSGSGLTLDIDLLKFGYAW